MQACNATAWLKGRNTGPPTRFPSAPAGLRVLLVAPHPDDFDIVACTLRELAASGAVLSACVLSCGSGVENGYCENLALDPTPENIRKIRAGEQRAGCNFFGLAPDALRFLDLEESGGSYEDRGQALLTPANVERFCEYFASQAPDVVFLPAVLEAWPLGETAPDPMASGNLGHWRAGKLVEEAVRRAGSRPIAVALHREPKTISIRTCVFTPYDAAAQRWKGEMLRLHDSQHKRNLRSRGVGFDERLLKPEAAKARDLGLGDEVVGAEVFQLELPRDAAA
jgi:LmbE family N-acetylglucosaminyl deacetylase